MKKYSKLFIRDSFQFGNTVSRYKYACYSELGSMNVVWSRYKIRMISSNWLGRSYKTDYLFNDWVFNTWIFNW